MYNVYTDTSSEVIEKLRQQREYQEIKSSISRPLKNLAEAFSITTIAGEKYRFDVEKYSGEVQKFNTIEERWETTLSLANFGIDCSKWLIRSIIPSPSSARALVNLAYKRGDLKKVIEIDVERGLVITPQEGGFFAPPGNGGLVWVGDDAVVAFIALSDEEKTHAGHPRKARLWSRFQEIERAPVLSEVRFEDLTITVQKNNEYGLITHHHSSNNKTYYLVNFYEQIEHRLDIPLDAQVFISKTKVYTVSDSMHQIVINAFDFVWKDEGFVIGEGKAVYRFEEETVIRQVVPWEEYLVLVVIGEGAERLLFIESSTNTLNEPFPEVYGSIKILKSQSGINQPLAITWNNLLNPPQLAKIRIADNNLQISPSIKPTKNLKSYTVFSQDGTPVRYFLAQPENEDNIETPTLLLVYGGFSIPFLPSYIPEVALGWLSRGGQVVIGQIRGGGERGRRWHAMGQREGKLLAVDDIAAIAQNLISRKLCTAESLVCEGTSNGGLLISLFIEKYPELCIAAAVHNAVFDLSTYDKYPEGNGWKEEYGAVTPESKERVLSYSPIHNIPLKPMPPLFISAELNDDRVDPTGAIRMVEKLREQGQPVVFRQGNGSHHGAANVDEASDLIALTFRFFIDQIEMSRYSA